MNSKRLSTTNHTTLFSSMLHGETTYAKLACTSERDFTSPVTRCFPSGAIARHVIVFRDWLWMCVCLFFRVLYSTTTHLEEESEAQKACGLRCGGANPEWDDTCGLL